MRVTLVKKRLASGEPCRKCVDVEDQLRRRGLWDRIDRVVWALEGEPDSEGMQLAVSHGAERAPFFLVEDSGETRLVESVLRLAKTLAAEPAPTGSAGDPATIAREAAEKLAGASPQDILQFGQATFGADLVLAFSGAEDVAVIDMASKLGGPFSVLTLDTGRLHSETYDFIDRVRRYYRVDIDVLSPDPAALEPFVRHKGLFSFYEDGHQECCSIRKVAPLRRGLIRFRAWATGQRRDQSVTRTELAAVELDTAFEGAAGPLVKLNPLASWTSDQVWDYLRAQNAPTNPLHEAGYASIGCAPCTRAISAGQSERDGRWWWETPEHKECGLHGGRDGSSGR